MPDQFQKKYIELKSALARAIKSKNQDTIIAECNRALKAFDDIGYPDDWSRWERVKDDAKWEKSRIRQRERKDMWHE